MRKVFNSVNVCTSISGIILIMTTGFVEGGNYIAAIVCVVLFSVFAYLAMLEDGYFRKKNRPR